MTDVSWRGKAPGILNDQQIAELCTGDQTMISPFVPYQVRQVDKEGRDVPPQFTAKGPEDIRVLPFRRVVSYGLTSYGYDLRAGENWQVFDSVAGHEVDPKNFLPQCLREAEMRGNGNGGTYIRIPPNSYALCGSVERFQMPDDVVGIAVGKSTYARCGIIVNVTPLEPGWTGHLTIEVSNATPLPARVYIGEGLLQVQFWRGVRPAVTYADRAGKYQGQAAGPVTARL